MEWHDLAIPAAPFGERHDAGGNGFHDPLILFAVGVPVVDARDAAFPVVGDAVQRVTAKP